jgi:hypothetical protein
VPPALIFGQHAVSLLCFALALPFILHRLWTLDPLDHQWGFHLELLVLLSFYPLLDLVNGWALWRHGDGEAYDWHAHRDDNVVALIVLTSTVVIAFAASDKTYFFSGQQPLAWRLGLEMVPSALWLASGRMVPFLLRPFRGAVAGA